MVKLLLKVDDYMRNSLVIKLLIIFASCIGAIILASYVVKIARESNSLTYDLGESSNSYSDIFLTSFSEYESLANDLGIKKDLTANNFVTNYYLASFQDYDKCSEERYKLVNKVNLDDNELNINFKVYNKCGWCKKHSVLYLIELPKFNGDNPKINYTYDFEKEIDCGNV